MQAANDSARQGQNQEKERNSTTELIFFHFSVRKQRLVPRPPQKTAGKIIRQV